MKNICLLVIVLFISVSAKAQTVSIPDANFKARLLLATINSGVASDINGDFMVIDTNSNNEIEVSEALAVYVLNVEGSNISSLTGIEYFTNLRSLSCNNNSLISLPIASLVNLSGLYCSGNMLGSLAEAENLNITDLTVDSNPLTSVNLSNFHQLWRLNANNTTLTEINLCGTAVRWLWCIDSPNLQALYLKNNVVSSDLARMSSPRIPPPLHNFEFYNSPQLNYICYDDGELPAVNHAIEGLSAGITVTTSCNANCSILSVDNPILNNPISIYPNPTSGIINIAVASGQPIIKTTINNLLGQTVLTFENPTTLDISLLTKGTYIITVETTSGAETQKIIKL